jgi:hypothetical protein
VSPTYYYIYIFFLGGGGVVHSSNGLVHGLIHVILLVVTPLHVLHDYVGMFGDLLRYLTKSQMTNRGVHVATLTNNKYTYT